MSSSFLCAEAHLAVVAKVEDSPQITSHEQPIRDRPARHCVLHAVPHECATVDILEGVRVHPAAIRAANLRVGETERWLPIGDLSSPPDRNAVQTDLLVDQLPSPHFDRPSSQHAEIQPPRRQMLQLERI